MRITVTSRPHTGSDSKTDLEALPVNFNHSRRNELDLTTPPTTEDAPPLQTPALEPPAPETAHSVKTRAISGVKVLAARTLISVLLRVVSSLVLARLLFPKDYGLFGVVSYITGLGMFLTDVGLASALVRQETKPTRNEAFTVFWTQQIITGLIVAAVIGTAPLLLHIYHLSPSARTLLYAMGFGLFLSSLRVVPMMALERDLQFPTIARCELLENLVQTGSTIAFAYLGWGAWALAGGGLARGVVGLVLVWAASPWRPEGRFELAIVKRLAKFGFAFQLNGIISALLAGWMPLVVGRVLGVAAVGLVGWATNIASVPLMISGVLNRVAFPAYSRLQSDPEALGRYLGSSVRRISAVFSLLIPLVVIVCPVAIPSLFHSRWIPAIPLVQWFTSECILLTLTGILASTQQATGYASERLCISVIVGALRWGFGYLAVKQLGLFGIGPVLFLISLAEMWVTVNLVKHHSFGCSKLMQETMQPLLTTGAMLAASLGTGWVVAHQNIPLRTLVALIVFVGLVALREFVTGGRILCTELHNVYKMFTSHHIASKDIPA